MDNTLIKLAEFYGIELTDKPGCTIVGEDGVERLATAEDVESVFGISMFQFENGSEFTWDSEKKVTFKNMVQWKIKSIDNLFEVA